jgi:hypothetical protein
VAAPSVVPGSARSGFGDFLFLAGDPAASVEHMFDTTKIEKVIRKIAAANPALYTDDELHQIADALATFNSRLTAGLARLLGELEARGACERDHGLSTASWFAREANVPPDVARALVKAGRPGTHPAG